MNTVNNKGSSNSISYKFSSGTPGIVKCEWHKLFFCAPSLSLLEFKRAVVKTWNLNEIWATDVDSQNAEGFDLKVKNQFSGEEYQDNWYMLFRGVSVVISKIKSRSAKQYQEILATPDVDNVFIACDEQSKQIQQLMIEADSRNQPQHNPNLQFESMNDDPFLKKSKNSTNQHQNQHRNRNQNQQSYNGSPNSSFNSRTTMPPSWYVCRRCKKRAHHYFQHCVYDDVDDATQQLGHTLNNGQQSSQLGHPPQEQKQQNYSTPKNQFLAPVQDPKGFFGFSDSAKVVALEPNVLSYPTTIAGAMCPLCEDFIADAYVINCCYTTACFVCLDACVQTRNCCPVCNLTATDNNLLPNPKQQKIADSARLKWAAFNK